MKRYEPIEHTADIGIRAYGRSLKELFENAAEAMFGEIAELKKVKPVRCVKINLKASSKEELFHLWLSELLYQFNGKGMLFSKFEIEDITERGVKAIACGEKADAARHGLKKEIKAVTYHGLLVEKKPKFWVGEVIFDV